jgi:hypothetical protein
MTGAAFLHHRDQGDMVDEVDVQEERDFLLAEVALYLEETAVERLVTDPADGCLEISPVVRSKRPDFEPTSVAQRLKCRIGGCFQHSPASLFILGSADSSLAR